MTMLFWRGILEMVVERLLWQSMIYITIMFYIINSNTLSLQNLQLVYICALILNELFQVDIGCLTKPYQSITNQSMTCNSRRIILLSGTKDEITPLCGIWLVIYMSCHITFAEFMSPSMIVIFDAITLRTTISFSYKHHTLLMASHRWN